MPGIVTSGTREYANHTDRAALAQRCAPKVHPDTILAVIQQESARYQYALSINYPKTEAARQGYAQASYELARQPATDKKLSHGHAGLSTIVTR